MERRYAVCAYREWNKEMFRKRTAGIPDKFMLISSKDELTEERLREINPEYVFFLDWSWIVPSNIVNNFRCVNFHTAPLPEFRGGSPIQNQIIRGIKKSKLTAHFMTEKLDAGDILLQEDVSLEGHLMDIFSRISEKSFDMIMKIIAGDFTPRKQEGDGSCCKRRTPQESELGEGDFSNKLEYLYDFIRMLEDPYPNAFIRMGNKKIIFKEADFKNGKLSVKAEIEEVGD